MFKWSPSTQPLRSKLSSELFIEGFKSSEALAMLGNQFESFDENEKQAQIRKTKAIFEVHISQPSLVLDGPAVEEAVWTIDVKHGCRVYRGPAQPAPDVTLRMSDEVFCKLAEGELDGRKAFFAGQLKMKGKFMLAPKFGSVFLNAFDHNKL